MRRAREGRCGVKRKHTGQPEGADGVPETEGDGVRTDGEGVSEGSSTVPGISPLGETTLESGAPSGEGVTVSKHPLWELFVIAAPTIVTMTSYTIMQLIDAVMVSRIGEDPVYVGAQGNGGMYAWIFISLMIGGVGIVNTFVSQNLGAGRARAGAAYAWNALYLGVVASVLFVPFALIAPWVFAQFGHTGAQLKMESEYARVLLYGAFFTIGVKAVANYFYGLHRPIVVTVGAFVGIVSNVFFNAVFIYGSAGAPEGVGARAWRVGGACAELVHRGIARRSNGAWHRGDGREGCWGWDGARNGGGVCCAAGCVLVADDEPTVFDVGRVAAQRVADERFDSCGVARGCDVRERDGVVGDFYGGVSGIVRRDTQQRGVDDDALYARVVYAGGRAVDRTDGDRWEVCWDAPA